MWLSPSTSANTATIENLTHAALQAEASFHPPPCAGAVFLHHVSICDECSTKHPNAYDDAVLSVPK
jgi:hypothetical protein